MRINEGSPRSRNEDMEARTGLFRIMGAFAMMGDIAFTWKSDQRIFRAFRKGMSGGELGPEVGFGLL